LAKELAEVHISTEPTISTSELAGSTPPTGSFRYPHLTIVEFRAVIFAAETASGVYHPRKELLGQVTVRLDTLSAVEPTLKITISFFPSQLQVGLTLFVHAPLDPFTHASTRILSI
jgi:hypothetical protein